MLTHGDRRQVCPLAVLELLLLQLDPLLRESGIHALEGGALALILVVELGARELRQHLALGDPIASVHEVANGSRGCRIESRAHRGDHSASRGDIVYGLAARDGGKLEAPKRHDAVRFEPRACPPEENEGQSDSARGPKLHRRAPVPGPRRRVERHVPCRCAPHGYRLSARLQGRF